MTVSRRLKMIIRPIEMCVRHHKLRRDERGCCYACPSCRENIRLDYWIRHRNWCRHVNNREE